MRNAKKILTLLVIMIMMFCLSGCDRSKDEFYGKWGYVHDPKTTIIQFKTGGRLVYNGVKYDYTLDDQFFYLVATGGKNKGDSLTLRYEKTGEGFLLYQTTKYTYQGEGAPDGVLGLWVNTENKWSFEFTDQGTFKEDSYFPGYYVVNDENKTMKLIYNDQFVDTIIYFTIEGDELTMDYPWLMVKG